MKSRNTEFSYAGLGLLYLSEGIVKPLDLVTKLITRFQPASPGRKLHISSRPLCSPYWPSNSPKKPKKKTNCFCAYWDYLLVYGCYIVQFLLTDFRVFILYWENSSMPGQSGFVTWAPKTDIQKFNSSISIIMSICYGRDGFYETFLPLEEKLIIMRT